MVKAKFRERTEAEVRHLAAKKAAEKERRRKRARGKEMQEARLQKAILPLRSTAAAAGVSSSSVQGKAYLRLVQRVALTLYCQVVPADDWCRNLRFSSD